MESLRTTNTARPLVSVIIVNFGSASLADRCLAAAARELASTSWDAALVDNPSPGPGGSVAANVPGVRVIRPLQNLGFARAVNRGVRATRGRYLLLVNPDCTLGRGSVAALVDVLEQFPNAAAAGPRVLEPDGQVQGTARRDPSFVTGLFGRSTLLTRLFPDSPPARAQLLARPAISSGLESVAVDWISGACMLVRRSAFEAIGGFDEEFFLFWEDADLCRRLRAEGHQIQYVTSAVARHEGGACSRLVPALAIRAFHRSAYRYYVRHVAMHPKHPGRLAAGLALGLRCACLLGVHRLLSRQTRPLPDAVPALTPSEQTTRASGMTRLTVGGRDCNPAEHLVD